MFQVRIHGRGGQGVVTAAEMLSVAAFLEGKHSQAFPSFGSERMGAPVVSFCRISDNPIRSREPIFAPDAVIVQDPTLIHSLDVLEGLTAGGFVLINTSRPLEELELDVSGHAPEQVRTVPATDIAMRFIGRPIPNAALLGAFAALTRAVDINSVLEAIRQKFPGAIGASNQSAALAAHEMVAGRSTEAVAVLIAARAAC